MVSDQDCEGGEAALASWVPYQVREFLYNGKRLVGRSFLNKGQGRLSVCLTYVVFVDPEEGYGFKCFRLTHQKSGPDAVTYVPFESTDSYAMLGGVVPFLNMLCYCTADRITNQ